MQPLPQAIIRPTRRQLRQFAAVMPLAVLLICWTLRLSGSQILIACLMSAALAVIAWPYPFLVQPIYVGVSLLTYPIGLVVSELVMLAVYVGLITPIALFFRFTGRDGLERTLDRDASTYWRVKKQPGSVSSYLRRW